MHGTTAVLSFESNLAYESQHLLHHLQINKFQRWLSLAEGAHNQLGWLTTNGRKEVRGKAGKNRALGSNPRERWPTSA